HKPAVGVARDAADLVEGGHDAAGARLDCGVVRRQVDLPQGALGHVHGVVIPAPFGTAVCGEVLDGGHDGVGRAQVLSLKPSDAGPTPSWPPSSTSPHTAVPKGAGITTPWTCPSAPCGRSTCRRTTPQSRRAPAAS